MRAKMKKEFPISRREFLRLSTLACGAAFNNTFGFNCFDLGESTRIEEIADTAKKLRENIFDAKTLEGKQTTAIELCEFYKSLQPKEASANLKLVDKNTGSIFTYDLYWINDWWPKNHIGAWQTEWAAHQRGREDELDKSLDTFPETILPGFCFDGKQYFGIERGPGQYEWVEVPLITLPVLQNSEEGEDKTTDEKNFVFEEKDILSCYQMSQEDLLSAAKMLMEKSGKTREYVMEHFSDKKNGAFAYVAFLFKSIQENGPVNWLYQVVEANRDYVSLDPDHKIGIYTRESALVLIPFFDWLQKNSIFGFRVVHLALDVAGNHSYYYSPNGQSVDLDVSTSNAKRFGGSKNTAPMALVVNYGNDDSTSDILALKGIFETSETIGEHKELAAFVNGDPNDTLEVTQRTKLVVSRPPYIFCKR